MAKLDKYVATIDTKKYAFRAPAGLYAGDVSTQAGIAVAPSEDQDLPEYPVKELLKKGILRRLTAITTTGAGKRSQLKLLCAKDKLATILDGLKNKSYSITGGGSGTIKSVGFSRRVVSRG
ncbi:hypothetical protein [Tolypothrix sp. PCC 7601]|uniref:hypothetical protein n=1 Tax=Tolypothrix sp. PCC 7601 TaxID=1188 RepID=UPI0005EAC1BE|nr:hypothetical protein [Tolypothrix sp. PCC 7601]EKE98956.1 hypothetical protein FDUTEX481_03144 [Tolypothrix sp. PCC 7601]UYD35639.1 hypothetical protein HG267_07715 [Tolypothrix sp. PCC 7601]BAY94797.1 hypothetical protein NIES3275_68510 [Microchaete diplosiphon NIES-3275]